MTRRHSTSYQQMERTLDEFPPTEHVTTHLVINGQAADDNPGGMSCGEVLRELADLVQGAEVFEVLISYLHDDTGNTALVALNGPAVRIGDLAAWMVTAKAAHAR